MSFALPQDGINYTTLAFFICIHTFSLPGHECPLPNKVTRHSAQLHPSSLYPHQAHALHTIPCQAQIFPELTVKVITGY